jgi:hypothetical protein
MIDKLNFITESLTLDFSKILGYNLTRLNAFCGNIFLNEELLSIDLGVDVVLTFTNEGSLVRFQLTIQGDDFPVKNGQHIGLKFDLINDSYLDASNYRFGVDFSDTLKIQKITFWSFAWRDSTFPRIINVVVFSLQKGKNLFIHLGSTSDAILQIKEQSIEEYFNEKNQFYDNEYEIIELFSIS